MKICDNPVFVIGSPRSGTTILAWSLAEHSAFAAFGESQVLSDLFADGRLDANYCRAGRPYGSWLVQQGVSRVEFLQYVGLGLNALFTSRSKGLRWIDQTPNYTRLADTIADMFPGARFLHILRDGRRVVHSMVNYPVKTAAWSTDFTEACRKWRKFVNAAFAFAEKRPHRCLTVINEHLSQDPRGGFQDILRFLDALDEPGPAEFFATNRINSSFAPRKGDGIPEYRTPDPSHEWSDEERKIFVQEAGDCYQRYCALANRETSVQPQQEQSNDSVRGYVGLQG